VSSAREIKLEPGWKKELEGEFEKPYMSDLRTFLKAELTNGKTIYPRPSEYFAALNTTPFEKVRVVILGQDPYHGPDQAHGLCFSVKEGVRPPPSLQNIFKELQRDLNLAIPRHGTLTKWGEQGVLLLNATLSVESGHAGSHQGRGWEIFTDRAIQALNESRSGLIFVLWGSFAQKKAAFIDRERHTILAAPHPSPLSAHRGFLGCGHFSKINQLLLDRGEAPIDWDLNPPLELRV
jgi:uracil-DNA glycosylase